MSNTISIDQFRQLQKNGLVKGDNKKRNDEEYCLQRDCVSLFYTLPQYRGMILFSIPNGEKRDKITAAKLKASGVISGIPDTMLAVRTKKYGGLFLEAKSKKGVMSKEQKIIFPKLIKAGYSVVIFRSQTEFLNHIDNYLKDI